MADNAAYDLFVLLDLESPDERRSQVVDSVRNQLQQRGSLKGDVDWGTRKLAYEIDHRGEAQYHLFQFEAAPDVLSELDRSLSIEDAVIRHRIIRLPGEAPDAPPPKPSAEEFRREERGDRPDRGRGGRGPRGGSEPEAEAPPAAESAPATEAPATTEAPPATEPAAEEPAEAQPTVAPEQAANGAPPEQA